MPKKLSHGEYVIKSRKKHGDKYEYPGKYLGSNTPIEIICKIHGSFFQRPNNHINMMDGCPDCGNERTRIKNKKKQSIFILEAKKIHQDKKYDYSEVNYKNAFCKVKIICPIHGSFLQTASTHLNGHYCPKCALTTTAYKNTKTLSYFVKKAEIIHGDKYKYFASEYKSARTKLKIHCCEHGLFYQKPMAHLRGHGCPSCAKGGFNPLLPGILYYFIDINTGFYKIGITNYDIEKRFSKWFRDRIRIISLTYYQRGRDALKKEKELHEIHQESRIANYSWLKITPDGRKDTNGYTEFFKIDVLKEDCILLNRSNYE